jgi:DNA repair exonuclease SbcCD nuclease subunit
MRTLVIGDIHLSEDFTVFKRILFPYLIQIITQYKVDKILFLGDIFDSSELNNTVLSLFKQLMGLFDGYDIEILVGNHDKIETNVSSFDLIMLSPNIKLFSKVKYVENHIYLPHITKRDDLSNHLKQILEYVENKDYDRFYVYSHNDFSEVYSFTNSFFKLGTLFDSLTKEVYLVNGHNHVPVFKNSDTDKLKILNIGNAVNLS